MTTNTRNVSRRYAKREFFTVGLVLIIYCLLALYFPLVINELLSYIDLSVYFPILADFDLKTLCPIILLIIGTVLPFFFLRIASKKKVRDFNRKNRISIIEHFTNFIVFFVVSFGFMFATMMISQRLNVNGQLVSSIGITFNNKYMSNIIYIISFIIITPILEEYAFRGVLLSCLSRYGKYFAVVASSLIYMLAHGSFVEMLPSFFMGLILSKKALYYKSIKPVIVMHILFNLALYSLIMIPESYNAYMIYGLVFVFVLAIILVATRTYRGIEVKKSYKNSKVGFLFLFTPSIVLAILLFIAHSALLLIL